ncbi:amidase [Conexibacter woesei]|uniref:Amidase n=1 Tax=Conexibacter woesei (strain DSM 14684 / CCUG 47730 / CIP 108061 / JCM 11494 / NBRC 100937 / ID131577) TaxID=469383 RepID=D3F6I5_CONWI|nr:amidase [Conexibacter woesei]ADB50752.1 Amidase [Conexibacter woesei DSM 14684]
MARPSSNADWAAILADAAERLAAEPPVAPWWPAAVGGGGARPGSGTASGEWSGGVAAGGGVLAGGGAPLPVAAPGELAAARALGAAFAWVPPDGAAGPVPASALVGGPLVDASGPLDGVRLAVKELIAVAGAPHGDGSARPHARADADAPAVAALRRAGARLLGTTASTELAFGVLDVERAPVANPRHAGRVPGGSSAGSAAAVAAGVADLALGTDTGGSVRIPAAWTGTVGFKPTWGAVSTAGVVPLAWSLDHVGLIGSSVAVIAAGWEALAGAAHACAARAAPAGAAPAAQAAPEHRSVRVGVVDLTGVVPLSPAVATATRRVAELLAADGAELRRVGCGPWRDPAPAHLVTIVCELAAAHGLRPGGLTPAVADALAAGAVAPATLYLAASGMRRLLREQLAQQLAGVDVLLLPTVPCEPPPVGATEVVLGGRAWDAETAAGRLTTVANLAGVPAVSVPADADAAAVAVQLVGRAGDDARVLACAQRVERLLDGGDARGRRAGGRGRDDGGRGRVSRAAGR